MKDIQLAGCIITNKDNKILLLHRNTLNLVQWEIPGGKIESRETPEVTAIREIKEELNIDVSISRLIGQREFSENNYLMNYFWCRAEIVSGSPSVNEPEKFDQIKFFSISELEQFEDLLSPNTKNLLKCYLNNEISI